jgi:glycine dehydrogenase
MIAMHGEVKRIERGDWPKDDNPMRNAPHTAEEAVAKQWTHPYTREDAVFPVPGLRHAKYWPPVGRIDNVYGDRNFICTCPPMESYKTAAE